MNNIINFISTGPFLIGWIIGIYKFDSNSRLFALSLQEMFLFLIYILILFLNHVLAFLNVFNYSDYPYYIDSVLALLYLFFSIKNYLDINKTNSLHKITSKLLNIINKEDDEK